MPVLLEDTHEDVHAWKEVKEILDPNAVTAPPAPGFATWLTTLVALAFVLLIAGIAYGPTLLRNVRRILHGYRVTGPKVKGKATTKAQKGAKAGAKGRSVGLRRVDSEEQDSLKGGEEDDEDEDEDEDEEEEQPARVVSRKSRPAPQVQEQQEEEEDEEEEDEEEDDAAFERRFPVGSEAVATNLREKKYLQHNKKVGIIRKVDAANGKVYIEMKASGAKLVLRAENVVPVDKGRRSSTRRSA